MWTHSKLNGQFDLPVQHINLTQANQYLAGTDWLISCVHYLQKEMLPMIKRLTCNIAVLS